MAEKQEGGDFLYRISTGKEWEEFQNNGSSFGGELDKSTGCFHLSQLDQVQSTLQNFFLNSQEDLYLLQIDAKMVCCIATRGYRSLKNQFKKMELGQKIFHIMSMLGDGLIYELVDGSNSFPHFYGPSRSFAPLPLAAVTKAEKLPCRVVDLPVVS